MNHWTDKLALVAITLWVGALWSIGLIAAPVLFSVLAENQQQAGQLAGAMFVIVSYISLVSGFYLLIQRLTRQGTQALKQSFFWGVFFMLLLAFAGHFGIQPILEGLKQQAMPADVMKSVFAERFRTWHGVASISYLIQCLLGLLLVLKVRN